MADSFNNFFNSVFTNSKFTLPSTDSLRSSFQQSNLVISTHDVHEALSNLNNKTAMVCNGPFCTQIATVLDLG